MLQTKLLILPSILSILLLLSIPSPTHAQSASASATSDVASPSASQTESDSAPLPDSGLNLSISPPILSITVNPGASTTSTIKLYNYRDQDEALQTKLLSWKPDSTGATPLFQDVTTSDDFVQWIHLSETKFVVPTHTWKEIQITLDPPSYAAPALYFAIAFQRQRDVQAKMGATTQATPTILCLTEITSSRVIHQVDLVKINTKPFYEFLPVDFEVTLQNNGNVHEMVFGNMFIDWVTGHQTGIGSVQINNHYSYILPQTTRVFTGSWTDGLPAWNTSSGKKQLNWNFANLNWFRIGQYHAHMVLAYNDGVKDIPIEADTSFWVVPWRILLGMVVVIGVILIGLKGTLHSLYKAVKSLHRR